MFRIVPPASEPTLSVGPFRSGIGLITFWEPLAFWYIGHHLAVEFTQTVEILSSIPPLSPSSAYERSDWFLNLTSAPSNP